MTRRAVLGGALALVLMRKARAQHHPRPHEPHWYDHECCNERDCAPALPGRVVEERGGWLIRMRPGEHPAFPPGSVSQDYFVPHGDPRIRPSKDERAHPCVTPGAKTLLCVYVPMGAS
jgi:hypothetical protein